MEAIKYDDGKVIYTKLNPQFIKDMATVMTIGAKKYHEWNWVSLDYKRIINSLCRHMFDYINGIICDNETGITNLAHVSCNCMMLYFKINNKNETTDSLYNAEEIVNSIIRYDLLIFDFISQIARYTTYEDCNIENDNEILNVIIENILKILHEYENTDCCIQIATMCMSLYTYHK